MRSAVGNKHRSDIRCRRRPVEHWGAKRNRVHRRHSSWDRFQGRHSSPHTRWVSAIDTNLCNGIRRVSSCREASCRCILPRTPRNSSHPLGWPHSRRQGAKSNARSPQRRRQAEPRRHPCGNRCRRRLGSRLEDWCSHDRTRRSFWDRRGMHIRNRRLRCPGGRHGRPRRIPRRRQARFRQRCRRRGRDHPVHFQGRSCSS
jgi:hypothetical protein